MSAMLAIAIVPAAADADVSNPGFESGTGSTPDDWSASGGSLALGNGVSNGRRVNALAGITPPEGSWMGYADTTRTAVSTENSGLISKETIVGGPTLTFLADFLTNEANPSSDPSGVYNDNFNLTLRSTGSGAPADQTIRLADTSTPQIGPGGGFSHHTGFQQFSIDVSDRVGFPTTLQFFVRDDREGQVTSAFLIDSVSFNPPPAGPSVTAAAASDARVSLTWTGSSPDATSFEIERANGFPASDFAPLATVPGNVTSFEDEAVAPETTYSYRVRSRSAAGPSEWSAEVHATTSAGPPSTLVAEPLSPTRMRLRWPDVSQTETGFEIQRAPAATRAFARLAVVGENVEEYVDATARPEALYLYRVASLSPAGPSSWVEVTAPPMPAILAIHRIVPTASAPPRVLVTGEFDVGGHDVDLASVSTIRIGDVSVELPAAVRRQGTLRSRAEGARLDLVPARQSSRVRFRLAASDDLAAAFPRDGDFTLSYVNGDFRAMAVVQLSRGAFRPPRRGRLEEPACYLVSAAASLRPGEADALELKFRFDTSDGVPQDPPVLSLEFGDFQLVTQTGDFHRIGPRLVLKRKIDGARESVTLDYAKGIATIAIRGGTDLGEFTKGPAPVRVAFAFDGLVFDDTLTLRSTGRSLRY